MLSKPVVQDRIRLVCENELSRQLGARVTIDDLSITPFNRADIRGVTLKLENDTIARMNRVSAGIDVWDLFASRRITINYATILGFEARVSRDSLSAPLNIQPIIDCLNKKDPNKTPSKLNLRVNTIVLRDCDLSYDVYSEPQTPGLFNASHISITDLRADASVPKVKGKDVDVNLLQLDFKEQSGVELENLSALIHVSDSTIAWEGVEIAFPRSKIDVSDGKIARSKGENPIATLLSEPVSLEIAGGSYVYPAEFASFMPELAGFTETVDVNASLALSAESAVIDRAEVSSRRSSLYADIENAKISNPFSRERLSFDVPYIKMSVANRYADLIPLGKKLQRHLPGTISFDASSSGSLLTGKAQASLSSDEGDAGFNIEYNRKSLSAPFNLVADMTLDKFNGEKLLPDSRLGLISGEASVVATIGRRQRQVNANVNLAAITYSKHRYDSIMLTASVNGDAVELAVSSADKEALFDIAAQGSLSTKQPWMSVDAQIINFNPHALNLTEKYEGVRFSTDIHGDIHGSRPDRGNAAIEVSNLAIASPAREDFVINDLSIKSYSTDSPRLITLNSDFINGRVEGDYNFKTLSNQLISIVKHSLPILNESNEELMIELPDSDDVNNFNFSFTINETDPLRDIFKMPVTTIYPLTISGLVDSQSKVAALNLNVPFMRQGNKIIESTLLDLSLDGNNERQSLELSTRYPSNDGLTTYVVKSYSQDNDIVSDISWKIDRERRYDGQVLLRTSLNRDDNGEIGGVVNVERSNLAFNDSVWTIHPATITYANRRVEVDNVSVSRDNQYVKINGVGSVSPSDSINIDILNFDLGYLFDAIGIENFQLGGIATGSLAATEVLSAMPKANTSGIAVTDISFNDCVLGNAIVKSHFDMADKAVVINGVITQPNNGISVVDGRLYPFSSELDFNIHADCVKVGFMDYYMQAFASDISGLGSGDMRIFGDFHDVDIEGDVFAENLKLKLDFTNTYYTATDSIHLSPGLITLHDITLKDLEGHSAKLNGKVTHEYFRAPKFNFIVSDIESMLVYDEPARPNADWYGRIHASGEVNVAGDDDLVAINIDVTSAEKSKFTFVLSNLEVADEYNFLTFRDKALLSKPVEVEVDEKLTEVNRLKALLANKGNESSADYEIELKVAITPDMEVDLVMDPVAGDKIRSTGSGNMRIVYASKDNDLRIFGTYTLNEGLYNFTLQDIIIKDFAIKEGSAISFTGDPLAARLDIKAYYALNANLTDLDESFGSDKDLNRTNVPVHALLNVTNDIQQPEITFDLEFPTLTSDVDRKVRSIISTEEMMNRQIIYLLALNRFYTPDYMSTTKGNELFSVASSTISSQLSSILGQLSDKFMISPNFRSDRGDFSDMEVDLALSSRLLNNRLLLNGNFGYRDKSLNTNQFIGDFDIEYLLNKSGTIRLKAYNRYNDQNYYLRSANTTQGVGVLLKHDFDNIFGFLRRKKPVVETDSLPVGNDDKDEAERSAPIEDSDSVAKTLITLPVDTLKFNRNSNDSTTVKRDSINAIVDSLHHGK